MKRILFPCILTFLAFALCVSGVLFFPLLPVAYVISPFLFSLCIYVCRSRGQTVASQVVLVLCTVLCFILTGSATLSFVILLMFVPVGISVGFSCLQKKDLNITGSVSLVSFIALAAVTVFVFVIEHTYPQISFKDTFNDSYKFLSDILISYIPTEFESYAGDAVRSVISYIPSGLAVYSLLQCAVVYRILGMTLVKYGSSPDFTIQPFTAFRVSRTGSFFFFIVTIISLLVSGNSSLSFACENFVSVMSCVMMYAGASVIIWILDEKGCSRIMKTVIFVALCIIAFVPVLSYVLSLVGLVDSYIDLRSKFAANNE